MQDPVASPTACEASSGTGCSAVFPISIVGNLVYDATGSIVLICDEDRQCSKVWNEIEINKDPHFICPECGRLGQRMVELRPTWGPYHLHTDGWFRLYPQNPAVRGRESPSVPCTGVVRHPNQDG